jgi:hypothetical protein
MVAALLVQPAASFAVRLPATPGATRLRLWADPASLPEGDSRRSRSPRDGRVELGEITYPVTQR